jgi:hypothetical protein
MMDFLLDTNALNSVNLSQSSLEILETMQCIPASAAKCDTTQKLPKNTEIIGKITSVL